jgi:hypothetical protein
MNIQSLKQQMTLNKKHMDAIVTQKDSTIQLLRDSVKQKDLDNQLLRDSVKQKDLDNQLLRDSVKQKDLDNQLLRDSVKQKDLDVQALNEKIHLIETKTNDDTTIIEEEIQKSKLSYKKSGPFIMLT